MCSKYGMFDFNRDGKTTLSEEAFGLMILDDMTRREEAERALRDDFSAPYENPFDPFI